MRLATLTLRTMTGKGPRAIKSGHFMAKFWLTYKAISKPRVFPSEAAQEALQKHILALHFPEPHRP
jgi:hypothetical protein